MHVRVKPAVLSMVPFSGGTDDAHVTLSLGYASESSSINPSCVLTDIGVLKQVNCFPSATMVQEMLMEDPIQKDIHSSRRYLPRLGVTLGRKHRLLQALEGSIRPVDSFRSRRSPFFRTVSTSVDSSISDVVLDVDVFRF